jgi:hypothetical protein
MVKKLTWREILVAATLVTASASQALAQMPMNRQQQVRPLPPSGGDDRAVNPPSDNATPQDPTEQLSRSPGVIEPPPTGDQNIVPAPSVGPNTMPIIPPPGTPGKNPGVQPK